MTSNGDAPKKNGRPRKELPGDNVTIANAYDQLETMAGYGFTLEMMASILGVSKDTLDSRRAEDQELCRRLEKGKNVARANRNRASYNRAVGVQLMRRVRDGKPIFDPIIDRADDQPGDEFVAVTWPTGQPVYVVPPDMTALIWLDKTRDGLTDRIRVDDERPPMPGQLPQVPLETLREAVRAAEQAQAKGKVLPFHRKREA